MVILTPSAVLTVQAKASMAALANIYFTIQSAMKAKHISAKVAAAPRHITTKTAVVALPD